MTTQFNTFKALHSRSTPFILPNAWDAESAQLLQECGFPAVGTSSAAVAASLGYQDGEGMPFTDYLFIIRRMAASVTIPVTIDMEMGYGNTPEVIYANVQRLMDAGVVGINIEDSIIIDQTRSLKGAEEMTRIVEFVRNKLTQAKQSLFINLRCDTYLLKVKDATAETARRIKMYEAAGADGIFLPFIQQEQDIAQAVATTSLPLNVMAIPGLPDTDKLHQLGVKRISMGPFLHNKTYRKAKELAAKVLESNSVKSILS